MRFLIIGIFVFLHHIGRASRASTKDFCPALAALVSTVQNIFFLAAHYLNSFVALAQQTGSPVS